MVLRFPVVAFSREGFQVPHLIDRLGLISISAHRAEALGVLR
ncbi:hypothetical protein SynMVIR181_00174 [Synechococcus sp. MVIR-18-1]|nr:hypothetical protein SynMVIR181_00174 [Synechococcus sp. MVIR-18-1]